MRRLLAFSLSYCALVAALFVAVACVEVVPDAPSPTPSPVSRPAPTATATAAPTRRPTLAPTPTALPRPTAARARVFIAPPTAITDPTPVPTGPTAITITRVRVTSKVVALTFDAGADRGYAPELLSLLKADEIKATFGTTGRWAENNPDMMREIVSDGHELMNHTFDHRSFTGASARQAVLSRIDRMQELEQTDQIDRALTGVSPKPLFRPPYGDQDSSVLRDVAAAGYQYSILWTVDSRGWKGLSTQQIVDRCLRGAEPGAIYVFHVDGKSRDVEALPEIIAGLRELGYTFATVGELLHLPPNPASSTGSR